MSVNLTCTQVGALLSFYMDDRLNEQLKQFVESHLDACPACRAKYEALKDMVSSLKEVHDKISALKQSKNENARKEEEVFYKGFRTNLSAYIDNELDDTENIKVKKYVISNPKARKELEKLYELKKILHNSFEKSKNETKEDYSKYILRRIDIQEEVYGNQSFAIVITIFILLFILCSISAMVIFLI